MAVNIDTVYQRVLTLANKEQRGYVTPQEFNLLANQAQMEIFEQYFYDIKQLGRMPGNDAEYSDPLSILYEKIGIFENEILSAASMTIPFVAHKLGVVSINGNQAELLNVKDFNAALKSRLTSPTEKRPIICIVNGIIRASNTFGSANVTATNSTINIRYVRRPSFVNWGYAVINDKSLYNPNISADFQLHGSEETELVYKILKLAGINLKATDVSQAATALETTQIQQEKQ